LLQLRQQPAFFQGGRTFRHTQRALQHQGFGFAQGPNHRFHRVPPQLFQGGEALVTVDHQVAVRLLRLGHHDDRRLLPGSRQRSQQSPLSFRSPHPQGFPAPIELV
jgi:hypothetical protein